MTDPRRGIGIPHVPGVDDLSERGQDLVPPALILERTTERFCNESAPSAPANPAV